MREEIFKGMIISYGRCDEINDNVFVVKNSMRTLLRDDEKSKKNSMDYLGKMVNYLIEEVRCENNLAIGRIEHSKKITNTNQDESKECSIGVFEKILDWGGFINIDSVQAKILNKDVFDDNTRVFEVFKEGDIIKNLKFKENKISLHAEVVPKMSGPKREIKKEDLVKGKKFEGTIRTIMPTACFVYILNERDVICSIPDQLEEDIERGSKVIVKLTTVSDIQNGNEKLRGKIVKIIEG